MLTHSVQSTFTVIPTPEEADSSVLTGRPSRSPILTAPCEGWLVTFSAGFKSLHRLTLEKASAGIEGMKLQAQRQQVLPLNAGKAHLDLGTPSHSPSRRRASSGRSCQPHSTPHFKNAPASDSLRPSTRRALQVLPGAEGCWSLETVTAWETECGQGSCRRQCFSAPASPLSWVSGSPGL